MPMIYITCPVTGRPIATGLSLPEKYWDVVPLEDKQLHCPHCGQIHAWSKQDARLTVTATAR